MIPRERLDTLRADYASRELVSVSEHAAIDLAVWLAERDGERVVSLQHQWIALRYVRRFGFEAALDRLAHTQAPCMCGATDYETVTGDDGLVSYDVLRSALMKSIRFKPNDGASRKARLPHEGAAYVIVEGLACPCSPASPFHVAGVKGSMVKGHDTYTSDAGCVACKVVTGKLIVTVNTLFGIEEDERVLAGRCRVY